MISNPRPHPLAWDDDGLTIDPVPSLLLFGTVAVASWSLIGAAGVWLWRHLRMPGSA